LIDSLPICPERHIVCYSAMAFRFGFLVIASQAAVLVTAQSTYELVQQGVEAFKNVQMNESIHLFDEAIDEGYPVARLWQRGISLYYADRFQDGSKQFRDDTALNPNDTEESIWAFVCDAQTIGFDQARKQMMVVSHDSRMYMQTLYSMFRGEVSVDEVEQKVTEGTPQDAFYYSLYLGLYEEAAGDAVRAQNWITQAALSNFATSSGDYMGDVAVVHGKVRGWLDHMDFAIIVV